MELVGQILTAYQCGTAPRGDTSFNRSDADLGKAYPRGPRSLPSQGYNTPIYGIAVHFTLPSALQMIPPSTCLAGGLPPLYTMPCVYFSPSR